MVSPNSTQNSASAQAPKPIAHNARYRLLKTLLGVVAALLLVVVIGAYWVLGTASGARTVLGLISQSAGVQFSGISGSFTQQLSIQHIDLHTAKLDLQADDISLQWRLSELWQHRLHLDFLRVNNLKLATPAGDGKPATLPKSLQLPAMIKSIQADQLSVNRFELSTLEPDGKHSNPLQFEALSAQASIDSSSYRVTLSGTTPWGNANAKTELASAAPFNLTTQLDWQGLALNQDGLMLPVSSAHADLSGNLSRIVVQANLKVSELAAANPINSKSAGASKSLPSSTSANGTIHAIITPFAPLPLEVLQFDLRDLNPATFYADAPKALLGLVGDFKLLGTGAAPELQGDFSASNARSGPWNLGAIPVTGLRTKIAISAHQITWQSAAIELGGGASANSSGSYIFPAKSEASTASETSATRSAHVLPSVNALLSVVNLDLLQLDGRLKKTQLSGKADVASTKAGMQIKLDLTENQARFGANLVAQAALGQDLKIDLKQFSLSSNDAKLSVKGKFDLQGKQAFELVGEAQNFNPARWIDVPAGRIGSHFSVAGQLQQGWLVDAKVAELSGQFAGLNLQGQSDAVAQEGQLLSIKKLEFNWGKNHLSASGNWQLGALNKSKANAVSHSEKLQLSIAIPDLSGLSKPFQKLVPVELSGAIFVDAVLSGNAAQPSGTLAIKATKLAIPNRVLLDNLQASLGLAEGTQGRFEGNVDITGLVLGRAEIDPDTGESTAFSIDQIKANLSGVRHAHQLNLLANLPQQQQVALQASGDLHEATNANLANHDRIQWQGQIAQFNLTGPLDFHLDQPFALQVSSNSAQIGAASWQGKLGQLKVGQLIWSDGTIKTAGSFQGLPVVTALRLWRKDLPLTGKLMIDAAWHLDLSDRATGELEIKRSSGDLSVRDLTSGHVQSLALGLQNVLLKATVGDPDAVSVVRQIGKTSTPSNTQREPIHIQLLAQGKQLGSMEAQFNSMLNKTAQGWEFPHDAPLSGTADMSIQDIQFLSQLAGSGVALRGKLNAHGKLMGSLDKPDYAAQITGQDLQVSLTDIGVLLPNGTLDASLDSQLFKLTSLKFSQAIKNPPKHDNLTNLAWLKEIGVVESSGAINWQTKLGAINTNWQRFPFIQNPDSWMVASGDVLLGTTSQSWNVTGQLNVDAAYFSVPKDAAPRLSSDVVVLKKNAKKSTEKPGAMQSNLDFSIRTGKNFVFVGRGLDTSLDGDIRLRSKNGSSIQATGSIQTVGGNYEGYGQKLAIERGIINFQGAPDNPGLNVRAMRRGLPVEAGVEVIGTVAKPEVRLISEPNVPDSDKLSWMVLGRGSDQMAGSEAALLMSAAGAIFGGDSSSSMPRDIAHTLGLDDISLGTTSTAPGSQLPAQTVAGSIGNTVSSDQVFSVGKHLTPNLVFSIERSLTDATNGIKLTWQLTRRFSLIGRTGSDNAIDGQYTFSFDSNRNLVKK